MKSKSSQNEFTFDTKLTLEQRPDKENIVMVTKEKFYVQNLLFSNLTLLLDLHEFNMGKTIRKASEETIQGQ